LILSFAAGLFVDPDPGPVLANTGLENLRFLTPLYPGDSMRVELTVRSKSLKSEETGVVRWAVEIFNQKDELVATYDLLTENLRFLTPLYPGDSMRVELTVRSKSLKSEETGVVRWAVEIFNQRDELVATYDLLTENVP
jgi:acyl dehydratase